jgi:PAS domain S-box-containing protein
VESSPSAMVMINMQGVIEMVNTQAERIFGYTRAELLGQQVELLLPLRLSQHHPHLREAFFSQPQSRPMGAGRDLYARRKDGSEFPVEIGLNPIETDEGTKVLSAIVDISDRKQKEQKIQAALEEKNILLGEIHHRVKNNLQIVHSLLDLQSSRVSDPVALEMLRDSQNRIRSMALIHQSLYLSNNFAQVNLGNVLEALIPTLLESYSVDHSLIRYEFTVDDVLLSINQAIPCGLIINELISNALKHAFPGGRSGTIHVELAHQGEDSVRLSVSDDGVGIAPDVDLKKTDTLGLQLVHLLADQLGATLRIKRADPTRFELCFPQQN